MKMQGWEEEPHLLNFVSLLIAEAQWPGRERDWYQFLHLNINSLFAWVLAAVKCWLFAYSSSRFMPSRLFGGMCHTVATLLHLNLPGSQIMERGRKLKRGRGSFGQDSFALVGKHGKFETFGCAALDKGSFFLNVK